MLFRSLAGELMGEPCGTRVGTDHRRRKQRGRHGLAIPRPAGDQMLRAGCGRAAPARGPAEPARHHAPVADARGDGAARGGAGDVALARPAARDVARARAGALHVAGRVVLAGHVDRAGAALDVALGGSVGAGVPAVVISGAHTAITRALVVGGHTAAAEDGGATQKHQANEKFHRGSLFGGRPEPCPRDTGSGGQGRHHPDITSRAGLGGAAAPGNLEAGLIGAEAAVRRRGRAIGRGVQARGELAVDAARGGGAAAAVVPGSAVRALVADRAEAGAARVRRDAARGIDAVEAALLAGRARVGGALDGAGGATTAAPPGDAGLARWAAARAPAIRVTEKGRALRIGCASAHDHEQTRDRSHHAPDASTTPRTRTSMVTWSHRDCAASS